ncbi:hypothetical protein KL929_001715 [Ogataea haglerorum]|nr:hypothetical protein KL948_001133 [Ogataea haglerorum]KAG7740882.1 hypothetical protein KL923_001523 [Ogataea haglerorum]KAG7798672.1 hypothetical protein KL929_001715 [Ogataea haglerorum]
MSVGGDRTMESMYEKGRARERAVEISAPYLFVKYERRNESGIRNDGHDAERRHNADGCQTVADKVTHLP